MSVLNPQAVADYVQTTPRLSYVQPTDPPFVRAVISSTEAMFGRAKIQSLYDELKARPFDASTFFTQALEEMRIDVRFCESQLAKIPDAGPLVHVANHPFGVVDGLIMCALAMRVRGDFRILIHAMLCQDDDLAPFFLPIDFQPGKAAMRNNIRSKQLALECLENDIPLLIFPSGMVSTATSLGFGAVRDAPWTTFVAKLVREVQATVVPMYFHGYNSRKFHVASHIAEPLRMALLMNEVLNKSGRTIDLEIGNPMDWELLKRCATRQALTDFLYARVQSLATRPL